MRIETTKRVYLLEIIGVGVKVGISVDPIARMRHIAYDAKRFAREVGRAWVSEPNLSALDYEFQLRNGHELEYMARSYEECVTEAKALGLEGQEVGVKTVTYERTGLGRRHSQSVQYRVSFWCPQWDAIKAEAERESLRLSETVRRLVDDGFRWRLAHALDDETDHHVIGEDDDGFRLRAAEVMAESGQGVGVQAPHYITVDDFTEVRSARLAFAELSDNAKLARVRTLVEGGAPDAMAQVVPALVAAGWLSAELAQQLLGESEEAAS